MADHGIRLNIFGGPTPNSIRRRRVANVLYSRKSKRDDVCLRTRPLLSGIAFEHRWSDFERRVEHAVHEYIAFLRVAIRLWYVGREGRLALNVE